MKAKDCLEMGLECGLSTVGEAFCNIDHHAMNIFVYDKIPDELKELNDDLLSLGATSQSRIKDVLKQIK